VSRLLGIGSAESVRKRTRQAEKDRGARPGTSTEESVEVKRLRRENAELKRAYAILKARRPFLRPSRPARSVIVAFMRDHEGRGDGAGFRWGVESICAVLSEYGCPIAPSVYYEQLGKAATAAQRRERLTVEIARGAPGQLRMYGTRKVSRWATRSTTLWQKRSTASTRPS
jgi:hypothetical protein